MKHRKKIRRGAILALVLVLLLNTMGVQAGTGEPTVTVSDYGSFYTAVAEARDGDVIGISGVISIPSIVTLDAGSRYIVIKRMNVNAKLLVTGDYGEDNRATFNGFLFDGNASAENAVGGRDAFIEVRGNATFNECDFEDCFYEGGNGGALYVQSGEVKLSSCSFLDNCADYGGAIFNKGTLTIDNCTIKGNWAEEMGGSIYNAGTLTMRNTEIKDSTARIGGGIYNNSSAELYNSLVWSNTASIHGSDLANEGSLSNYTTDDEYNSWLSHYQLYYAGWQDELNTSIGGAGEHKKFLTTDIAPTHPVEPDPDDGGGTGEDAGNTDPITSPSEGDNTGDEGTDPSTPSGGNTGGDTNNSNTDNSSTDNSTTDNSSSNTNTNTTNNSTTDNSTTDNSSTSNNSTVDSSVADNSTHTEDNSGSGNSTSNTTTNISTTDNHSSSTQSTDNSSHSSTTDNSYKDTSTSTVNNYYPQEVPVASQNGSQPINIDVPVNITMPKQSEAYTGTTEAPEQVITVSQDIKIEAEGVDLVYEYTDNEAKISIKASKEPESEDPAVTTLSTSVIAPEQAESPQESPNWVEVVTMLLLAVLVLGELRDKWKSR